MNRRAVLTVSLLLAAGLTLLIVSRVGPAPCVAWEHQLPARDYVHCLAIREEGERPILVAGVQQGNYGSRDYDNYIVCFDLGNGDELWRRHETEVGNLRGGKRPTSIEFDPLGDLIVGWDYFAVEKGNFEVVSKLSASDGSLIWDWTAPSEGDRSLGTGYSHGAWIFCDGPEILVKIVRSVGNVGRNSDMQEFHSVIDSSAGQPIASSAGLGSTAEARWRTKAKSLAFIAADGSEVTWGRYRYEHRETNWLKWRRGHGLWLPESRWERRERVLVTLTPPHRSGSPEDFFVGPEEERVLFLLYETGAPIPSAALLIDMSEEAKSRRWRVVSVANGRKLGRSLAQGTGISHNYDGPIRLTRGGTVVISGSMLCDQSPQKITVWK